MCVCVYVFKWRRDNSSTRGRTSPCLFSCRGMLHRSLWAPHHKGSPSCVAEPSSNAKLEAHLTCEECVFSKRMAVECVKAKMKADCHCSVSNVVQSHQSCFFFVCFLFVHRSIYCRNKYNFVPNLKLYFKPERKRASVHYCVVCERINCN